MNAGKFGIVVVIIALAGALLGAWVMSMDVNEDEVTKYRSLAEMTGEFQSEPVPEYTNYNPSTNYTGYYTDDSVIGEHTYFGGVQYQTSNPNNYRLDLMPEQYTTSTQDMTQTDYSSDLRLSFFDGPTSATNPNPFEKVVNNVAGVTMTKLIAQVNPDNVYNRVYFSSLDSYSDLDNRPNQNTSVDWCLFACKSKTVSPLLNNRYIVVTDTINNNEIASFVNPVAISAMVDLDTKLVTFYEDNDYTTQVAIYPMKDVIIFFGGSIPPLGSGNYMTLGTDLEVDLRKVPEPTYMDPSAGVEIG